VLVLVLEFILISLLLDPDGLIDSDFEDTSSADVGDEANEDVRGEVEEEMEALVDTDVAGEFSVVVVCCCLGATLFWVSP